MKAVTKTRHYDAIAREIQDLSGNKAKSSYKPSELAEGVRAVSGYQYEDGYYWGYTEGEEQGYNDGIDVGYNSGHKTGYKEGRESFPDADSIAFPDASITGKAVTNSKYYGDIATIIIQYGYDGLLSIKPLEMADALRKTIMDVSIDSYNRGSDEGRRAQSEAFWRTYQAAMIPGDDGYGTGQAGRGFSGSVWNSTTFYPMFDIKPRNAEGLFYYFSYGVNPKISLAERLKNLGIELDTSKMTSIAFMFYHANVDDIPTISAESSRTTLTNVFYNCKASKIRELIITENNKFSTPFAGCSNLIDITVSGTIGKNGFDMSPCTKLSRSSILSVLQTCNKNNAAVTVTLPKKCIDGKTETETYIANDTELNTALTNARLKGYTVSFD